MEAATDSFRAFAAREFELDAAKVTVTPSVEAAAGRARAFAASVEGRDAQVRGWVLPDGTVATLHHRLGRLFEEAGVFTAHHHPIHVHELVGKLLWASGDGYALRGDPSITVDKRGAGSLRFECAYSPPLHGMAPIEFRYDWTFKLEADHEVELEQKRTQ